MNRIFYSLNEAGGNKDDYRSGWTQMTRQSKREYLEPPVIVDETGIMQHAATALRSHWIGFVVIVMLCVAAALVKTLTKAPVYRAQALVEVMGVNQNFLNLQSMDPTSTSTDGSGSLETYLRTQIDILQSETLV